MSSIFHLEFSASSSPIERLALNLRAVTTDAGLVADVGADDLVRAVLTLDSGLWVSVLQLDDTVTDPFGTELGVQSVASVDLQLNGTRDSIEQLDEMLTVVFGLLARVPGDAVLHYEYAEVWLVRRSGDLLLADDDEIWTPDRLARVPPPYQRAELAVPGHNN